MQQTMCTTPAAWLCICLNKKAHTLCEKLLRASKQTCVVTQLGSPGLLCPLGVRGRGSPSSAAALRYAAGSYGPVTLGQGPLRGTARQCINSLFTFHACYIPCLFTSHVIFLLQRPHYRLARPFSVGPLPVTGCLHSSCLHISCFHTGLWSGISISPQHMFRCACTARTQELTTIQMAVKYALRTHTQKQGLAILLTKVFSHPW